MNSDTFVNTHNHPELPNALNYSSFVAALFKHMGSNHLDAVHAAVGISGEAGEILDAVKKIWVYNKEPDSVYHHNIIEELGDLNFYMTAMQNLYGITDIEIIDHNVNKLAKRYPKGYTDEAAIARADKMEEVVSVPVPQDTRFQHQKDMDNYAGSIITFKSSSYIDANNFKYCTNSLESVPFATKYSEIAYITAVEKGTDAWTNWYNHASKVPA